LERTPGAFIQLSRRRVPHLHAMVITSSRGIDKH